jgi:hypothetical protein
MSFTDRPRVHESAPPIEVELLSGTAGADAALMARIGELANEVYAVAEAGLSRCSHRSDR